MRKRKKSHTAIRTILASKAETSLESPRKTPHEQVQTRLPRMLFCAAIMMDNASSLDVNVQERSDVTGPVDTIVSVARNVNCALDSIRNHVRPFLPRQR